jgi:hypothetical protein
MHGVEGNSTYEVVRSAMYLQRVRDWIVVGLLQRSLARAVGPIRQGCVGSVRAHPPRGADLFLDRTTRLLFGEKIVYHSVKPLAVLWGVACSHKPRQRQHHPRFLQLNAVGNRVPGWIPDGVACMTHSVREVEAGERESDATGWNEQTQINAKLSQVIVFD